MCKKFFFLCKYLALKVRYGKALCTQSIPKFSGSSKVNITKGKIKIGKHFFANDHVYMAAVDNGVITFGNNCFINRNCIFACKKQINIGNNVAFGPNVIVYDHDHSFGYNGINKAIYKCTDIVIEDNCWIGAGVTILRGTHIGAGSVIGAGCVVKGEIPAHSLVTSDRALIIKEIQEN